MCGDDNDESNVGDVVNVVEGELDALISNKVGVTFLAMQSNTSPQSVTRLHIKLNSTHLIFPSKPSRDCSPPLV